MRTRVFFESPRVMPAVMADLPGFRSEGPLVNSHDREVVETAKQVAEVRRTVTRRTDGPFGPRDSLWCMTTRSV